VPPTEENWNEALVELVFGGGALSMVVFSVSTVHVYVAGTGSAFPTASIACTEKV
jgi:hypothetical protein